MPDFTFVENVTHANISPLSNNRKAVVLWNWQGYQATITAQWSSIGLASSTPVTARDLWAVCLLSSDHSSLP